MLRQTWQDCAFCPFNEVKNIFVCVIFRTKLINDMLPTVLLLMQLLPAAIAAAATVYAAAFHPLRTLCRI